MELLYFSVHSFWLNDNDGISVIFRSHTVVKLVDSESGDSIVVSMFRFMLPVRLCTRRAGPGNNSHFKHITHIPHGVAVKSTRVSSD